MTNLRLGRIAAVLAVAFIVGTPVAAAVLSTTLSRDPVPMHIRWKAGTTDDERISLERQFHLLDAVPTDPNTWGYHLADTSTDNIRRIVQHPLVEDTEDLNRIKFRPRFSNDRERRLIVFSVVGGGLLAAGLLATLLMSNPNWFTLSK